MRRRSLNILKCSILTIFPIPLFGHSIPQRGLKIRNLRLPNLAEYVGWRVALRKAEDLSAMNVGWERFTSVSEKWSRADGLDRASVNLVGIEKRTHETGRMFCLDHRVSDFCRLV